MSILETLLTKRSSVHLKQPIVSDLQMGELAVNTFDGNIFMRINNGADSVIQLNISSIIGDVTGTAAGNGQISVALADNAVTLPKLAQLATQTFMGRNTAGTGNVEALDITTVQAMLGISNINANTTAALALKENLDNKASDFTTVNNTLYPTVQAVQNYVGNLVNGILTDCGSYDPTATSAFPTTGGTGTAGAIKKGNLWYISVAGTINGVKVDVGDTIRAIADAPAQLAAKWSILETNIGFAPYPASNPSNYSSNSTDAVLLNRANHTGTQDASTVIENATQAWVTPAQRTAITHANRAALDLVSGTNTGNETSASVLSLLGIAAISGSNTGDETKAAILSKLGATAVTGSNTGDQTIASLGAEATVNKDTTAGYVGLTTFKINFMNATGSQKSFLTNTNTAPRTYSFPNKDGTVAMISDLTGFEVPSNKDATNGYVGLTGFALDLMDNTGAFKSALSNTNTAARAYLLPDKSGTIALLSDVGLISGQTIDGGTY